MAEILIRDLQKQTVERLKRRARRNGRSLQAEAKGILEDAAKLDPESARRIAARIRKSFGRQRVGDSSTMIRSDRKR